jgi:hypothetical protein
MRFLWIGIGSFECLLSVPVSLEGVLTGKIVGGVFFGFIVSSAVVVVFLFVFHLHQSVDPLAADDCLVVYQTYNIGSGPPKTGNPKAQKEQGHLF